MNAPRTAYRGYMICAHLYAETYWVEKDGFVIVHVARSIEHAKSLIDGLFEA